MLEVGCHLAEFGDGLDDCILALSNLLQLLTAIADGGNLHFVEAARALLAIAGDEGNGATLVEQFQRVLNSMVGEMQFAGNQFGENLQVFHNQ